MRRPRRRRSPSVAGPPPKVDANAYLVANAKSGEILAGANEDDRVQIASITKLMTALVVLEHAKPGDEVRVNARSSSVGESSIHLQAGERLTVRDLLAAALIQSANDSAFALAAHVGGSVPAFVEMMNAKAAELGLDDTHFVRPDGLDVPGHYSSADDVVKLAEAAMEKPLIRKLVRKRTEGIAGGRTLHTWNDLLGRYQGMYGVKTGHTDDAGWCEVAVAKRDGTVIYAVVLGSPQRKQRNRDLTKLLDWGFDQYGRRQVIDPARTYASAEIPFGDDMLELVPAKGASAVLPLDRPLVETVVAPAMVELPVRKGQKLGEVRVDGQRTPRRPPGPGGGRGRRRAGFRGEGGVVLWPRSLRGRGHHRQPFRIHLLIVTVTLNAAMDRTLLVPSFQLGHRHRASNGFGSAGGKGVNVARALRRLGVPVVCTGLVGGQSGTQIAQGLTGEGILNDFVRIEDNSRTSISVLDPLSDQYTEINEWGPEVTEAELEALREKLAYLTQGAEYVVLAGSLPRGVDPSFYAELIRDLNRRQILTVLDAEGEPLRLGVEAEPHLVSPNVREAEELVGHEFNDETDLTAGLDEISELGARNVLISVETGCYALVRDDREAHRVRGSAPRLEAVSTIGAGDTLLAGFLAGRVSGRSVEDSVRDAVAAGAASVLEPGAGRFDPAEAARLTALVSVEQLAPVAQDA